jgi:hypothetical protein
MCLKKILSTNTAIMRARFPYYHGALKKVNFHASAARSSGALSFEAYAPGFFNLGTGVLVWGAIFSAGSSLSAGLAAGTLAAEQRSATAVLLAKQERDDAFVRHEKLIADLVAGKHITTSQ